MDAGAADVLVSLEVDADEPDAWPLDDDVDCAFVTAFDDAWALLVEPVAVDDAWLVDCEAAPEEAAAGVLVSEFDWLSVAIFSLE